MVQTKRYICDPACRSQVFQAAHPRWLFRAGLAALALFGAALLGACGPAAATPADPPQPSAQATPAAALPNQPMPPALAALANRTRACDAPAVGGQPAQPPAALAAGAAHYDNSNNTIVLRRGAHATLASLRQALGNTTDTLRELAPGEWLLGAHLRVEAGASLRIAAPEARWLKLRSDADGFVSVKALGGQIEIADACLSSWDAARSGYDENYQDGRAFVLARDGARLDIQRSDLRYLGYDGPEAYGLAWRVRGTTGQIIDSAVSYNFYGVYSYEVDDLVIRGNEIDHNVMYGIDPHTGSLRLVIERNVAHDNGKHGIILAEECSDGVVRDNVAYNNLHHGIVIYQRSNNTIVEGNTAYGNGGHGINVNDSTGTIVRANSVYDNLEAGIGVGQKAAQTQLLGNQVLANRRDGVSLYSDVTGNTLRDNVIGDNARFGLYIKSSGELTVAGNEVYGNRVGVYINTLPAIEISPEANQIHDNREADMRGGPDAPAVSEGNLQ